MAKEGVKGGVAETAPAERSLEQIAKCLGYLVLHTEQLKGKPNSDLIPILASLGFDRNSVADILQTTPGTVSVRLSKLKAKSAGKGTPRRRSQDRPAVS